MNEKSTSFELKEPTSPEALVPASWVEPWMVASFVLLLLAVLAFFTFKKKRPSVPDMSAANRAAHAEAVAALAGIGDVVPRVAAVQCSLILRRYLSVVAGDPALFETHEEYVSRHESLKRFTEDARNAAKPALARLAAIKYSPAVAGTDTPQVVAESQALLEILNQGAPA
ncbi:hypothetical protein JIN84_19850 [Luteolibacter yonseiensis]|uniref:DUF4381 domain-containing protein n=1 Tax=Luteolibacter yonseiensis TaxID=1144680 RepID=A0A934R9Z7_9BACT|nr:hypothetical protein [Luteolibacter yonseiensis]MBK1817885.1 hypothetical protein [Luteolibacter yonseiensis]